MSDPTNLASLDELKARARRDDFPSMGALARALQAAGKSHDELLHECYGVWFPVEALVLAELIGTDREPYGLYTNQPWNLLIPLEKGGPPNENDVWDELEAQVVARDSRLLPLMKRSGEYWHWSGTLLCYRLDELAAGRSTVFGVPSDVKPDCEVKGLGDSLGAALREFFTDELRKEEAQTHSAYHRFEGDVEGAKEALARVDAFIAAVAERRRPKLVP
jgi:hypothetical protein